MPRYSVSRQKACESCTKAKEKCDRKPGQCTRCGLRGLPCTYTPTKRPKNTKDTAHNSKRITRDVSVSPRTSRSSVVAAHQDLYAESSIAPGPSRAPAPLLTNDLYCPIDADAIQNRWLNFYLSDPGQNQKQYPVNVTTFISRMLSSYVGVVVSGSGIPPFIHTTHGPLYVCALSTCLTLLRTCHNPLPGSESSIVDMIQEEMKKLCAQHSSYNDTDLLVALQAHLIYCMLLFFRFPSLSHAFRRQAMTDLQTLACASSRGGLVCVAERTGARPRWASWILAEAKRRTLYTMYLFDSLLSAEEGTPTLLGTELEGLPAPARRELWTAQTQEEWEVAYAQSQGYISQALRIEELWPLPKGVDRAGQDARESRVQRWLQAVDEFGTMLYAVTCCTHGV